MHHGRMFVTLSAIKQPREIRVQTFIVTHDARFEIVKTRDDRKQDDCRKDHDLICEIGKCGMNGSFKPILFLFH